MIGFGRYLKSTAKVVRKSTAYSRRYSPIYQTAFRAAPSTGLLLGEIKKPEAVSQWGRCCISVWATLNRGRFTIYAVLFHDSEQHGNCSACCRAASGHALGGVMSVYNRSQYLPEKLMH